MSSRSDSRNTLLDHTSTTRPGNNTSESVSQMTKGISFGVTGFFLFVAVLSVTVLIRRKCRGEDDEYEEPACSEMEEGTHFASHGEVQRSCRVDSSRQWLKDPDIKDLVNGVVIDCRRLTMGQMLGSGQFGAVYEAKLARDKRSSNDYGSISHEKVAVKTLKGAGMDKDEIEGFLREGIIMKDFHHPHVLGLVGVAFGDHSIPMIILPFMENGSLRDYITDPDNGLTVRKLLNFGWEVALGMDYLAEQKFVHRDLATRNCMLDGNNVVKVADFGLSRDIYTKEYYASSDHQARLPVKWMAVESLTRAVYTTKSDVWSYGVLLWELMTRGVTPYPDVTNWDMRGYVCSGRRMPKPEMCPDDIYDIMLRCWREDPRERPWFCDLAQELEGILSEDCETKRSSGDFYVNVDPLTP